MRQCSKLERDWFIAAVSSFLVSASSHWSKISLTKQREWHGPCSFALRTSRVLLDVVDVRSAPAKSTMVMADTVASLGSWEGANDGGNTSSGV